MSIAFNDIPDNLRIPGAFIEFDNSLAGSGDFNHKVLVLCQMLPAGTATPLQPIRITRVTNAEKLFGRGSMGHAMFDALLHAERFMEVWALPIEDDGAASAATGQLTITGAATETGVLNIYIAGVRVRAAVNKDDNVTAVAASVAAAINADTSLPVTAAAAVGVVTLTSRWKGETVNDIDVRLNYRAEDTPSGISVAITAMSGGAANPDITDAIANFGSTWWNWISSPYSDAANMAALEAELKKRYGPMEQKGGRAFIAYKGTHAASATFGSGRNGVHITCMGTNKSPTPPWVWSAVNSIIGAKHLAIDPARPLQTLALPGVLPPAVEDRWDDGERNLLLWDGISTYTVGDDGTVRIERQITMYQKNSGGLDDDSYLNINTPETLERIRYEQRFMKTQKFPRHKLANDGTAFGPGQPITTPKLFKAELLALYRGFIDKGWCEDYENYAETLLCEKDGDRLNYRDNPNLINQFRIAAGQNQFLN